MKSRLKKAALVGGGVYAGYKLGKLSSKFSNFGKGGFGGGGFGAGGLGYSFQDYNKWREADGFMCRSDKDCQWIDRNLECEDYEFEFTPSVSP